MFNTIGHIFSLTTFGESHGTAIGGVIDGCPSGLNIDFELIKSELRRRSCGRKATSLRNEADEVEFLSGITEGVTLGTPIAFIVRNIDCKSSDYDTLKDIFRPSHADYTYFVKYGVMDYRGGGRASGRTLLPCVVAGAIAKQILALSGVSVSTCVTRIGERCSQGFSPSEIEGILLDVGAAGDTVGAEVSGVIHNVPQGIGEPVFHKFQAELASAMFSINAAKGFEYGEGFRAASMRGTECNDAFIANSDGGIDIATNHSGGIQGGITNGKDVTFKVAFKPIPSVMAAQNTVNKLGECVKIKIGGRHDICVVPRVLPIVEAMAAMVTLDFIMLKKTNSIL